MQTEDKELKKLYNYDKNCNYRSRECAKGSWSLLAGSQGRRGRGYTLCFGTAPNKSIEEQTRQSLDNLGAILREAGMDYSDIVKTTVLLDSIKDFAAMNAVYAEYFEGEKPARMCYEVAALPMGAKVEIDAVAVK